MNMRACLVLALGVLGANSAMGADSLVAPGARPLCSSPGVPAGCAPATVDPPPVPVPPPIPGSEEEARPPVPPDGAIPPPPTGDAEMEKPAPATGPNSMPVVTPR